MRRTIGIVTLTLACTTLMLVLVWRWLLSDYLEVRYPASLYFSQIRAIDAETSKPIEFSIKWDYEAISPFIKGSGPARIDSNQDKTKTVALVGLHLKDGLPITIAAIGYSPGVFNIQGSQGGFLNRAAQVEEVKLRRSNTQNPAESKTEESEQGAPSNR